jgi:signal-transduction protein with cAMP-binding, CBS, and nucleotidyltransferase domain
MQTVDDLLNRKGRDVYMVAPSATVYEAARVMVERNVGAVLISTQGDAIGILSERDCMRRVMLEGRSPHDTHVEDVMTGVLRSVSLHDTVDHCMQMMTDKRVRHLPVVDNGRVVGMISVGDVVKAQLSEQEQLISGLESYIHGPSASARPPAS